MKSKPITRDQENYHEKTFFIMNGVDHIHRTDAKDRVQSHLLAKVATNLLYSLALLFNTENTVLIERP